MTTLRIPHRIGRTIITSFLMVISCILLLSSSAKAQQCSEVLKHGIYDISKTSTKEDLVESYLRWLSDQEVKNEQEARGLSTQVDVVLPTKVPIPVGVGVDSTGSSSSSYGKALAEYIRNNADYRRSFSQEFFRINANLVDAWRDCVLNRKGLICWAEQTNNPLEVRLKIEFRPLVLPAAKLSIRKITTSENVKAAEDIIGEELGANPVPVLFRRTGTRYEAVNFTIRTNDPNYICDASVESIPVTPPRVITQYINPKVCTPQVIGQTGANERGILVMAGQWSYGIDAWRPATFSTKVRLTNLETGALEQEVDSQRRIEVPPNRKVLIIVADSPCTDNSSNVDDPLRAILTINPLPSQ